MKYDITSLLQWHFLLFQSYTQEPVLSKRFEDALMYAAKLHARQMGKGSELPYIAYLMGVASIVFERGADEGVDCGLPP